MIVKDLTAGIQVKDASMGAVREQLKEILRVINGGLDVNNIAQMVNLGRLNVYSPIARMRRTTSNQPIPNDLATPIVYNATDFQSQTGLANNATGEITVPFSGKYLHIAMAGFATNATGERTLISYVDGAAADASGGGRARVPGNASIRPMPLLVYPLDLAAGAVVSAAAYQDSGGSLNVVTEETWMSVIHLRWP